MSDILGSYEGIIVTQQPLCFFVKVSILSAPFSMVKHRNTEWQTISTKKYCCFKGLTNVP